MQLELVRFPVTAVEWAKEGAPVLAGSSLRVSRQDLCGILSAEPALAEVQVDLAAPGEQTRIIHVLDAVEPRLRVDAPGADFPGFLSPPRPAGEGRWHVLDGVAVMTAGLIGLHEGLVEMSGPGAEICPLSRTWNLVLSAAPAEGVTPAEYEAALRRASLRLAVHLASATRELSSDLVETYALSPVDPALPRVGYLYFVQAQGDTRDTFLYGTSAQHLIPTMLHPNEPLCGAVVSGDFVIASQKNPTYIHQNNPVIHALYRRHGRDLAFGGVIIANLHSTMTDKERTAYFAAKLASVHGWQGVVISKEGGGNAYTDIMLACQAMEQRQIRTVLITNELAGVDGDQPSMTEAVPEADAIVSTGNNEALIHLPAVSRVIGGNALRSGEDPAGALTAPLGLIYCATNQIGWGRLTAVAS